MRLQFEMTDNQVAELDRLTEELQLKTRKDMLDTAVTLLKWAIRERKRGRIIASLDEQQERYAEVQLPALENVAQGQLTMASPADHYRR